MPTTIKHLSSPMVSMMMMMMMGSKTNCDEMS